MLGDGLATQKPKSASPAEHCHDPDLLLRNAGYVAKRWPCDVATTYDAPLHLPLDRLKFKLLAILFR